MAKTENLLQGRLGNLIFYQVKGVTRIRSVPLMVRNPETPAQQAVRKRRTVLPASERYPFEGCLAGCCPGYAGKRL